jgi:SAM-dependent methyltransferase
MTFEKPLPGFDEGAYLAANRDIQALVIEQKIPSGWSHFVEHGFNEYRPGVSVEGYRAVHAAKGHNYETALPPPHLRNRVHGGSDVFGYQYTGRQLAANILGQMFYVGILKTGGKILDFGCGPGRVIVCLYDLIANMQIDSSFTWDGTDIDQETIGWAQRFLYGIGTFHANAHAPPLPYPGESFDFVYSVSVFTHLPEDLQFAWLAELQRLCKLNGHLVLTTHGENYFADEAMRLRLRELGLIHMVGGGTEGLPSFYQTTFHDIEYIKKAWSRFFSIERIIPRGIAGAQDLVLCKRVI